MKPGKQKINMYNEKKRIEENISILLAITLVFLFLVQLANAQNDIFTSPITIWTNQKTYSLEDKIIIKAHVYNKFESELDYSIVGYIFHVKKDSAAISFNKETRLKPKEKAIINLYNEEITNELFSNGDYRINVYLYNGNQLIDSIKSANFQVKNVPERFEAELKICEDYKCIRKSKLTKRYRPYFKIESNKRYKISSIKIKNPDGTIKTYTSLRRIRLLQPGRYEIEVSVTSRQGEQRILKEKFARYRTARPRAITGRVVEGGSVILGLVLVTVIIVFLIYRIIRKKQGNKKRQRIVLTR